MDAVEYLKEKERMCNSFDDSCTECRGCEIYESMSSLPCRAYIFRYPEEAVAIVERWSKAHPKKTRQSEFLKMFPKAHMTADNIPSFCPNALDSDFVCSFKKCQDTAFYCLECRKRFWNEEVE